MLDHIPKSIIEFKNEDMIRLPNQEEVKRVVFELNGSSACGPYSFSSLFFRSCWEIVGKMLPNWWELYFMGRNCLNTLLTQIWYYYPRRRKWRTLRPISLSSFTNKIISRVIHERLLIVLPKIISQKQSDFVKERSITENVLLSQEIIRDINRRKTNVNDVVKLDMAKAYNRVSWIFLTKVLRKFCFSEVVIDMVWRLMSNNLYSV